MTQFFVGLDFLVVWQDHDLGPLPNFDGKSIREMAYETQLNPFVAIGRKSRLFLIKLHEFHDFVFDPIQLGQSYGPGLSRGTLLFIVIDSFI